MLHIPVLLSPILKAIRNKFSQSYPLRVIDATFGRGGYSLPILSQFPRSKIYAFDTDCTAIHYALNNYSQYSTRLTPIHSTFNNISSICPDKVDLVLFDLGVSSPQLDDPSRGFSFTRNGLLDMRMNQSSSLPASVVLNTFPQLELANLIFDYGQEVKSRAIAREICQYRQSRLLNDTETLAKLVARVVGWNKTRIHPATRTFQALRIYVNDELNQLKLGLVAAERVLAPGGLLAVVSFHSLEDRIVKRCLKFASRHELASFTITEKLIVPNKEEVLENPRSRSGKLRIAERTGNPCLIGSIAASTRELFQAKKLDIY